MRFTGYSDGTADLAAATVGQPPAGVAVRRGAFLRALEASGAGRVATCAAAVDPDPGSASSLAWNHTLFVGPSSALALFVAATLGLSTPQLAAILASARLITE